MTAKAIDIQILQALPLLDKEEKASLLRVIQSFLRLKDGSTLEEPPFDLNEYNREIDEAEAEMDRGEYFTQEEMEAEFAKWRKGHTS